MDKATQLNLYDQLSPLQKDIAQGVLAGKKPVEAYKASKHGRARKDATIAASVSELLKNPKYCAYMDAVQEVVCDELQLTASDIAMQLMREAEMLPGMAGRTTAGSRVSALRILCDYTGGFDKNKQTLEVSGEFDGKSEAELDNLIAQMLSNLRSSKA